MKGLIARVIARFLIRKSIPREIDKDTFRCAHDGETKCGSYQTRRSFISRGIPSAPAEAARHVACNVRKCPWGAARLGIVLSFTPDTAPSKGTPPSPHRDSNASNMSPAHEAGRSPGRPCRADRCSHIPSDGRRPDHTAR